MSLEVTASPLLRSFVAVAVDGVVCPSELSALGLLYFIFVTHHEISKCCPHISQTVIVVLHFFHRFK